MDVNSALPNPILRFKDGIARNTARIPPQKWEEHKELLCSLYREKTINEILLFMWTEHGFAANAGQLGRKLRKWGAYKYDGKNRPLDTACHTPDNHNDPKSARVILSDEIVPNDSVHNMPAIDASFPALSGPHSSPVTNPSSMAFQNDEIAATANSEMEFSQCVDKGKSKRPLKYLITSSSLFHPLTVIGAYRDATSLLDLVAERIKEDESIRSLRSSLRYGSSTIESHYKIDLGRFGKDYACGDSQARAKMEAIFMTFSNILLPSLQREVTNLIPNSYVYEILLSESESTRLKAAACLGALFHRLSVAAAATAAGAENYLPSEVNMPYPMGSKWTPETLVYPDGWPAVAKSFGDWGPLSSTNQPRDGSASITVPAISTVVEEPEDGGTPDIDMDRFSAMSLAPSSSSGFSSIRSLARRIRFRNSSSDRYSTDDPPSNVMKWNRSSSSLELFGQLPHRLSMASSQRTGSSRMSWRPEIPAIVTEDDRVIAKGLLVRLEREEEDMLKAYSRRRRDRPDNGATGSNRDIPTITHEDGEEASTGLFTRLILPKSIQTSDSARPLHIEHVTHYRTSRQSTSGKQKHPRNGSKVFSDDLQDKPVPIFSHNYMLYDRVLDDQVEPADDYSLNNTGEIEGLK